MATVYPTTLVPDGRKHVRAIQRECEQLHFAVKCMEELDHPVTAQVMKNCVESIEGNLLTLDLNLREVTNEQS